VKAWAANLAIFLPSGDHTGEPASPIVLQGECDLPGVTSFPFGVINLMPPQLDRYAIFEPSGDQAGADASLEVIDPARSRRCEPPRSIR
jgi:hypothetical protein